MYRLLLVPKRGGKPRIVEANKIPGVGDDIKMITGPYPVALEVVTNQEHIDGILANMQEHVSLFQGFEIDAVVTVA